MNCLKNEYRSFDRIVDRKLNNMDANGVGEFEIGIYECLIEFLSYYKFDSKQYKLKKSKSKPKTYLEKISDEIIYGGDFDVEKISKGYNFDDFSKN